MAEDNSRTLKIGEHDVTIQPFRGFKAVRAAKIVASATQAIRRLIDEVADFRRVYAERHEIVITKQLNVAQGYGYPDRAFDESGELRLPGAAGDSEVMAAVFPTVVELAERELIDLLALALTPNNELRLAWDNGDVDEAIKPYRAVVLHDAELPQLIELTGKVAELLRSELTGLGDAVGKLRDLMMGPAGPDQEPTTTPEDQPSEQTASDTSTPRTSPDEPGEDEPTDSTSPNSSPSSSTDSQPSTDGPQPTPSLASTGASSSSSEGE